MSPCSHTSSHHGTKQLGPRFACLWDAERDLGVGEAKEAQVVWPFGLAEWFLVLGREPPPHIPKSKKKKKNWIPNIHLPSDRKKGWLRSCHGPFCSILAASRAALQNQPDISLLSFLHRPFAGQLQATSMGTRSWRSRSSTTAKSSPIGESSSALSSHYLQVCSWLSWIHVCSVWGPEWEEDADSISWVGQVVCRASMLNTQK